MKRIERAEAEERLSSDNGEQLKKKSGKGCRHEKL